MVASPDKFDTFAFDAYGTLFDVHSAVARLSHKIGDNAVPLSQMWRVKQLEYTWVRSLMGQYQDFQAVTEQSLDFCMAALAVGDATLRQELLQAYEVLDAYEEVPHVLRTLKQQGKRIAIFSNGTEKMLQTATAAAAIGDFIDVTVSVDKLQIYKTAPQSYRLLCDTLSTPPENISFQSSNRWDIAGGKAFGLHCVWVNRTGVTDEYGDLQPHMTCNNLKALINET